VRALIDTGALLALSEARDQNHVRAVAIARGHRAAAGTFVGTTLILSELYSHLLYLRGPAAARGVLERLLDDPIHEWHEVDAEIVRAAATNWLNRFADQHFSLVDAVSFELMRQARLTEAFAFDHHFQVAGFTLLT
jgi:uncharacterized protein